MTARMIRNAAPMLALSITGCGGCGAGESVAPAPPPAAVAQPEPAPPPDAKPEQLARLVAETGSRPALTALLAKNAIQLSNSFDLKSIVSQGEGPAEAVGVVSKPTEVRSQGKTYLVASIVDTSGGPTAAPAGRVVIFRADGTVLKEFGQGTPLGGSAEVVSLGSPDSWFVHVTKDVAKPPFNVISDYYLINDELPRLLSVRHRDDGISTSQTPQQSKQFGESLILFYDSKNPQATGSKGVDPKGGSQAPKLVWDGSRRIFRGPSAIRQGDVPLFEVIAEASHGFEPSAAK